MENLSGPNLANASAIKDAANQKAMSKLVQFADRVEAIRKVEREQDEAMNSIDRLEYDLEQAYLALADRVGRARAYEMVMTSKVISI